jgi:CBS domain-containing protein
MRCLDVMKTDVASCLEALTVRACAEMMRDNGVGFVPVVDAERQVVGVVTDRDLALRGVARGRSPETPVRDLMTSDVSAVKPDDDLKAVEELMADLQVRRVPVVDEDGCCVGIIAQADIALEGDETDDGEVADVVERISEPRGNQLMS